MTLTTFFWILVGISILVLIAIRFNIKKELFTSVFWLLIGMSFMVLMGILWNAINKSGIKKINEKTFRDLGSGFVVRR